MQEERVKLEVKFGDWTSQSVYKIIIDISKLVSVTDFIENCQNMIGATSIKLDQDILIKDPDYVITNLN